MNTPDTGRLWSGLAGSLAAAVLFVLACPPFEYPLVAWFVPGLLLVSARRLPYRHAFESGLVFGVLAGGLVTRWLVESLEIGLGMSPVAASLTGYAGLLFGVGLPCGLLTLGYAYASRRVSRADRPIVGAFFWVMSEWVRSQFLGWELLGHTQFRQLWLIQIADIGGVFAVSFTIAFVSIAATEVLSSLTERNHGIVAALRTLALPFAALLMAFAYGVGARHYYQPTALAPIASVRSEDRYSVPMLSASYSPRSKERSAMKTSLGTVEHLPEVRLYEVSTVPQRGLRVSSLMCEDLLDVNVVRSVVAEGADVLINNCRVPWLAVADTGAADQHLALAVFRSVESRRYLVRSTNRGDGELITVVGQTLSERPDRESMSITRGTSPYMKYGDSWLMCGFGISLIAIGRGRGKSERCARTRDQAAGA